MGRYSLVVLVALMGCSYNPGGSITDQLDLLTYENTYPISGYCASSCTLRLSRDCVLPSSVLVLHSPTPYTDHWRDLMAQHYPVPIRSIFLELQPNETYTLTGSQAIALGATQC